MPPGKLIREGEIYEDNPRQSNADHQDKRQPCRQLRRYHVEVIVRDHHKHERGREYLFQI